MTQPQIRTVLRPFTHESMLDLLRSETLRSRTNTESCYDLTPFPLPTASLYFIGSTVTDIAWSPDHLTGDVSPDVIYTDVELVGQLLNSERSHPWWINLSPLAVTDNATVFDIAYSNDFTDRVFTGPNSSPGEPFHLCGPTLPAFWRIGDPMPQIKLPMLQIRRATRTD